LDQGALIQCLKEKTIAGAGLDVFALEPLEKDSPLKELENVIEYALHLTNEGEPIRPEQLPPKILGKTDASGNMVWNKTYGGEFTDRPFSLGKTEDGGYALTGFTHSYYTGTNVIWLIKRILWATLRMLSSTA
jgi:hypothetical protein